jgi:hypothetical protein
VLDWNLVYIWLIIENMTGMRNMKIIGAGNVCNEQAVWRDLKVTLAQGTYCTCALACSYETHVGLCVWLTGVVSDNTPRCADILLIDSYWNSESGGVYSFDIAGHVRRRVPFLRQFSSFGATVC